MINRESSISRLSENSFVDQKLYYVIDQLLQFYQYVVNMGTLPHFLKQGVQNYELLQKRKQGLVLNFALGAGNRPFCFTVVIFLYKYLFDKGGQIS